MAKLIPVPPDPTEEMAGAYELNRSEQKQEEAIMNSLFKSLRDEHAAGRIKLPCCADGTCEQSRRREDST